MVGASGYRYEKGQGYGVGNGRSGRRWEGTLSGGKSKTPGLVKRQGIVHRRKTNLIGKESIVSLASVLGVEHLCPTMCTTLGHRDRSRIRRRRRRANKEANTS